MNNENKYTDIVVTLEHPHGQVEVTLNEWLIIGPGSDCLLKPKSVKNIKTDENLPLSTIPLRYRNSYLSRFLMKLHLISDPWSV